MPSQRNWARTWTVGPLSFEIEWAPKASRYGFYLSLDFGEGCYAEELSSQEILLHEYQAEIKRLRAKLAEYDKYVAEFTNRA